MRDKLIYQLIKLRRAGWETPILPYGIQFDEANASTSDIIKHLYKVKAYRKAIIHNRICILLQIVGLALVFFFFLLCK